MNQEVGLFIDSATATTSPSVSTTSTATSTWALHKLSLLPSEPIRAFLLRRGSIGRLILLARGVLSVARLVVVGPVVRVGLVSGRLRGHRLRYNWLWHRNLGDVSHGRCLLHHGHGCRHHGDGSGTMGLVVMRAMTALVVSMVMLRMLLLCVHRRCEELHMGWRGVDVWIENGGW